MSLDPAPSAAGGANSAPAELAHGVHRYRGAALNLMRLCGAGAILGGFCEPTPAMARGARWALLVLLAGFVLAIPSGLVALFRSPAATARREERLGLAGMVQSLAFSYALVLIWVDLSISHPIRLLVGDLVEMRSAQVGAFLEHFGWAVFIGGIGLWALGWALGESGRSRQAIPRMGTALILGTAYFIQTRGIAARIAAGERCWVEGLVLFPALALPLIQLYAGTEKFCQDREAMRTPGLLPALAFGPASAVLVALASVAQLAGAPGRLAGVILVGGSCIAPFVVGWAHRRMLPVLGGHHVMEPALYRGLVGLGMLTAVMVGIGR